MTEASRHIDTGSSLLAQVWLRAAETSDEDLVVAQSAFDHPESSQALLFPGTV